MKLLAVLAALVCGSALVAASVGARPALAPAPPSQRVAIFYYPWYGTPALDGGYRHWTQNAKTPPASIASSFYPARGVYSSSDARVLRAQMTDIARARVGVVIVSWWGPDSFEAARLPAVAAAAKAAGLRVAVHLEPYAGRTPQSVAEDVARLRPLGISDFYVYGSTTSPDADWVVVNRSLHGVRLFANTGLPGKAFAGGFAGLYTYDVLQFDGSSFPRMCESARALRLVCAPSVGPGYDARAVGDPRVRSRSDGATYDGMWRNAVRAAADLVTITSYNEWHEGTQIEPAAAAGFGYASYDGAWGKDGPAARRAYLDRTAWWVDRYTLRIAALSAQRR